MHTFALRAAVKHVQDTGEWLVIVAPGEKEGFVSTTPSLASQLLRELAIFLPRGAAMGGRTALFPEGGRLSVVDGAHTLAGTGYRVMFLGYEGKLEPSEEIALHSWRQNAEGAATIGERPGELRIS